MTWPYLIWPCASQSCISRLYGRECPARRPPTSTAAARDGGEISAAMTCHFIRRHARYRPGQQAGIGLASPISATQNRQFSSSCQFATASLRTSESCRACARNHIALAFTSVATLFHLASAEKIKIVTRLTRYRRRITQSHRPHIPCAYARWLGYWTLAPRRKLWPAQRRCAVAMSALRRSAYHGRRACCVARSRIILHGDKDRPPSIIASAAGR